MNKFFSQTWINLKRIILRNKRFVLFDVLMPIIFYLLFTRAMPMTNQGSWSKDFLISMIIYANLLGSVITVANNLTTDRTQGLLTFVTLSERSKGYYYASMGLVFWLLNVVSASLVLLVGLLASGIKLTGFEISYLLLAMPLTCLPLVLLGIICSLVGDNSASAGMANLLVFPMAMISGLWWPITEMPLWLQKIGELMPTYAIQTMTKEALNNHFASGQLISILIWTFGLIFVMMLVNRFWGVRETTI